MTVTWSMVVGIAPEIPHANSTETDRIGLFITYALPRVSEAKFGDSYDLACAYMTAHMMTKSPISGGAGANPMVRKKQIGHVSIEYAVPFATPNDLDSTGYGQQFLQLRRERVVSATAVGVDEWLTV